MGASAAIALIGGRLTGQALFPAFGDLLLLCTKFGGNLLRQNLHTSPGGAVKLCLADSIVCEKDVATAYSKQKIVHMLLDAHTPAARRNDLTWRLPNKLARAPIMNFLGLANPNGDAEEVKSEKKSVG